MFLSLISVFPLVLVFANCVLPVHGNDRYSQYLDFVLKLFFAFGLAFEVPVATYLLIRSGLVSIESLRKTSLYNCRCLFFGMLLTLDIISQVMLAVPMWLLYEVGIYLCN